MKKSTIITLILIFSFSIVVQSQNRTYYYEKVAQVKNGNKTSASGDGHYLTMNSKILYESNPNGTSLNRGMMQYEGDKNGLHTYGGNAYLGNGLTYYFASDYSRLNVYLYDGTVLVYERKAQENASKMRQYPTVQPSPTPSIDPPQPPTHRPGTRDDNTFEYKCTYCDGTGRETINRPINVASFGIEKPVMVTCSECGYRYNKNDWSHKHQVCSHCNGKGKLKGKL